MNAHKTITDQRKKTLLLALITASLTILTIVGLLYLARAVLVEAVKPLLFEYALLSMSVDEKHEFYRQAVKSVGYFWDVVPEHLVARIGKRDAEAYSNQAHIKINNAGMRSSIPYLQKSEDTFRIVCLGDSFVFGEGGKEEDRYCNQLEAFYAENRITKHGKRIETYALGHNSWTTLQEATYLSSRISSYDPDIVLVLATANDITTVSGVTGGGAATASFSPEFRDLGSGIFNNLSGHNFGFMGYTALTYNMSPESKKVWVKAMQALRELIDRQLLREKHILVSVLDFTSPLFTETFKDYYLTQGLKAPTLVTDYIANDNGRLSHDAHPNRLGHSRLMAHQVHAMNKLGWLPLEESKLPPLHQKLSLDLKFKVDSKMLRRASKKTLGKLRSRLDFARLQDPEAAALLGGIFPDSAEGADGEAPWASVRSGFVLVYPDVARDFYQLEFAIRIPKRYSSELLPMNLQVFLNGKKTKSYLFSESSEQESYLLKMTVAPPKSKLRVLEVIVETDSYFTTIEDHEMKSFQLITAEIN